MYWYIMKCEVFFSYLCTYFRPEGMYGSVSSKMVLSSKLDMIITFDRSFFEIFFTQKITWD